jgi:hypothetical protein
LLARLVKAASRKDLGFMAASPGSGWRRRGAFANHRRYRKRISANVIFLTLGVSCRRVGSARKRDHGSKARLQ